MNLKNYTPGELVYEVVRRSFARCRYRISYIFNGNAKNWDKDHESIVFDRPLCMTSMICNRSFFDAPFVQYWTGRMKEKLRYHRKIWELVYICQTLYENDMLKEGRKGLVFGVGKECLPDLFASMGCEILATDLNVNEAEKKGWVGSAQHVSSSFLELNGRHICDKDLFLERVNYREVDMNNIPEDLNGFDFCWSACALEHLGNIEKGLDFIKNSMKTLKPGGLAVHTTEFNLYSNNKTAETDALCLFRRKDIERVIKELEEEGHTVYPFDWHIGKEVVDRFVDLPPFEKRNKHLRLLIHGYPCTSIGLIIKKGNK
ncbi:MAG: class I SAM-dependent methyltransferase [Lachnospiraceae bacterium]|nr:class I SAM-dependent methyltransferase [Lachnospiraceae bacterium]